MAKPGDLASRIKKAGNTFWHRCYPVLRHTPEVLRWVSSILRLLESLQ